MNRSAVKIITFFLLLCSQWQILQAQQLNIRNFSVEEGLPQSQIQDLYQDKGGIIWLSTNGGGISRFDGVKFHHYSTREGLNSNRVYCVSEDNGRVLIGTAAGLNSYANNKISKLSDTLINQKSIHRIFRHSDGKLWLGTSSGIVIYDGKKFSEFVFNHLIGNFQVGAIVQDKLGNTWISTLQNGIFCYDGRKMKHFTAAEGLNDMRTRDLLVNGDKVWIATQRGINVYDLSKAYSGAAKLDTLKSGGKPSTEATFRLYRDSSGVIWAGNTYGVSRITYGKVRTISPANGLCNPMITAILQDREGNLWFGAFGGGLSKYRNDVFINFNESHGLAHNTVMSFFMDSKDNMWIGTWGGGVSRMDYKLWKENDSLLFRNFVAEKEGLAFNNVWSICEDKKGNIWFGTSAAGVSVYDGEKFISYDIRNGLQGNRIQALLTDKKGNVWIGTENGVDKWDGSSFETYGQERGFSVQGVNAIYEDKLGTLWFGSPDKIIKYDGKRFTTMLRPEGFPRIRNIARDNYGYMWFSTDAGACVYNGKTFRMISEADGLSSNMVYYVKPDDEGNMWLGTSNGIDKLDLNQFVNRKTVSLKHYGKEEGFIGLECNQNSFYKDEEGLLWIGTTGGVTIYDPRQEKKNTTEAQCHITGIRLFLEEVDLKQYSDSIAEGLPANLRLPWDKNHVTFDFIAISHSIPGKVRYQFMLQGFDKDWLPQGKETSSTYSNLPPGNYTFLLRASNNDGLWNAVPLAYSFEVVPPFWKRIWFYIVAVILGITLIFALQQLRERSLRYSQRMLEQQVTIRTRELHEEKEKLEEAYSEIGQKNKDITDSIHYAKRIQEAILPPDSLVKQILPESFVLYKPKAIVSGDFYWIEQWGHQVLVAAADCTGHGVPGAFMSIVAHNILTQAVNVLGLAKPALILNETNRQLSKKLNQDPEEATVRDGMDIAMVGINYTKMTMEFAGANNPLWIIRNKEMIQINGDKFPIGAFVGEEIQKFTNHEWELQKEDRVYIFTDGFADQFGGPKGKKFKYKALEQLLLEIHLESPARQKELLEEAIEAWRGELEQVDDILIIGIRI